jgi:anthranilate 1,2-dioxygenase small subunit
MVVRTSQAGDSAVFQTGRYHDLVVRNAGRWRFKSKRVIYDTSRIQTALAIPI